MNRRALNSTATSGSDLPKTGRDISDEAVRARMAEFCARFDVAPIKLKTRKGAVYLTEDLMTWFKTSGASMDWILWGDAMPMAGAAREKYLEENGIRDALRKFDEEESKMFVSALRRFDAEVRARRERIKEETEGASQ